MSSNNDIRKWYNNFSKAQLNTGINLRHYRIINHLSDYGLKKDSKVLEIGCGIGTLTGLIHQFVKNGKLVATDISDESIEIAKKRISKSERIDFFVTDMQDFSSPEKFDFIVLPDVLEHIPLEQHNHLFKNISQVMHDTSIIVIHIPHPKALDYSRIHSPESLQIVDQSITAKQLMDATYANNLVLIDYKSYSVFNNVPDYVLATFRNEYDVKLISQPKSTIIKRKLVARIKFYWASAFTTGK